MHKSRVTTESLPPEKETRTRSVMAAAVSIDRKSGSLFIINHPFHHGIHDAPQFWHAEYGSHEYAHGLRP